MANNSLRAEGRFSLCRRFPSVFISSISSFLPLFVAAAFVRQQGSFFLPVLSEYCGQWRSNTMVLSMPLPPPILSTPSQSFFSSPESSSGFSSAFRPARLSSVVGFVRLLVRTVFSLVLCHDAVFGWSHGPSSFPLSSPEHY